VAESFSGSTPDYLIQIYPIFFRIVPAGLCSGLGSPCHAGSLFPAFCRRGERTFRQNAWPEADRQHDESVNPASTLQAPVDGAIRFPERQSPYAGVWLVLTGLSSSVCLSHPIWAAGSFLLKRLVRFVVGFNSPRILAKRSIARRISSREIRMPERQRSALLVLGGP
jgi:hypothetical protein